jgi:putative membrane protein
MRKVFLRVAGVRGFWDYILPIDLVMSTSMIFELIEWGGTGYFGSELGMAHLDSWVTSGMPIKIWRWLASEP